MSADSDFVRRERITDALLEFERRIAERTLPTGDSECWDLLLNRPAGGQPAATIPLRYETRADVSLLRVINPQVHSAVCLTCDLFGRNHCCGGLAFLYHALRAAGVGQPLEWLAVQIEPDLYLPDWELMADNSRRITQKLRDYFEAHLNFVSADGDVA